MRFAILAAVAALGMSGPANAATWVFAVTGDYNYQLFETLNLESGVTQRTTTTGVEQNTRFIHINSDLMSSVDFQDGTLVNRSSSGRPGQGFVTNWQMVGGNVVFYSATFSANNNVEANCSQQVGCYHYSLSASAQNLTSVFISSTGGPGPAPLPEPATWAMMIGGMGMVGGSMRSRRRQTSSATAP